MVYLISILFEFLIILLRLRFQVSLITNILLVNIFAYTRGYPRFRLDLSLFIDNSLTGICLSTMEETFV